MRVLLVYPLFPKSFWSFEKMLELVDRKALLPPLGLITVAALLPQTWEFRLVDRNTRPVTDAEWDWAELVILSAMIVQKEDLLEQIGEAKRRGKKVAVGGPYPTALPQDAASAGADYLILDEGEITLPMFVEAIAAGATQGTFRAPNGEKPDVTSTPIPRFDLLDFKAYFVMPVQFSRGCPFQCEFCDIIVLYGRKPRTKAPAQLLSELEALYNLGWRGSIFMVDDNFIGNKRNVKLFLKDLKGWQAERRYPFGFLTEASIDLAEDTELMDLMRECNFGTVFIGIETPDETSLSLTKKFQNTRSPLVNAVETITRAGFRIMAGFIIGFDGEKTGAGQRVVQFIEETAIPMSIFSMLQALPDTALWHRLAKEDRLLEGKLGTINQTTLMNFVPTRPLEEITQEYIDGFWQLYDPEKYLDRTYRHIMMMGLPRVKESLPPITWIEVKGLLTLLWRQGVKRKTRGKFWQYSWNILRQKPQLLGKFILTCAYGEHFLEYRQVVRDQIETQLRTYLSTPLAHEHPYRRANSEDSVQEIGAVAS
ncbi:MAG: B12-binding domain-containing radical SAM protein [Thermosynechococcaceae cyanobacterium]